MKIQVLDSIETKLFEFAEFENKSSNIPLELVRSALIAMNIFAQQQLKQMNGALISRFLNHATVFLKDNRPVIRVLAIRLMRIFCKKLPNYMIIQFQVIFLLNWESKFIMDKTCISFGFKSFNYYERLKFVLMGASIFVLNMVLRFNRKYFIQ